MDLIASSHYRLVIPTLRTLHDGILRIVDGLVDCLVALRQRLRNPDEDLIF